MTDIKSLADKLRTKITTEDAAKKVKEVSGVVKKIAEVPGESFQILNQLLAYDNSDHKSMVHVRFDAKTVQTMNQLKMATGVDVTRLVAYAVADLLKRHPELKTIIKQYIQNFDL